jgi:hypothetical protein
VTVVRILVLCLAVLLQQGCRGRDLNAGWGWNAERPATPMRTFSHELHRDVFAREHFQCIACHKTAVGIENPNDAADAIRASKAAFRPSKEACHVCHYNPQAGNIAPDRCSLCHADVRAIEPANHNFDWLKRHSVYAKADSGSCESCHRPKYCQDCHERRDETVRTYHDRNFRFVHGIEARANPMVCGQCHTPSFCEGCHAKGGYER